MPAETKIKQEKGKVSLQRNRKRAKTEKGKQRWQRNAKKNPRTEKNGKFWVKQFSFYNKKWGNCVRKMQNSL